MEFAQPLKRLEQRPVDALCECVTALPPAAWLADQTRQQNFDVHYQTQSVVMLFIDASHWPRAIIRKQAGWDWLAPVFAPVMHDILAKHYPPGGVVLRAMAAKLLPGSMIKPHIDAHPSFSLAHRIHIPLTTNERVRFMIDQQPYEFVKGNVYELNNQRLHSVMNKGKEGRITFIFDYLPPQHRAAVQLEGQLRLE
jgi:hypothetical protein